MSASPTLSSRLMWTLLVGGVLSLLWLTSACTTDGTAARSCSTSADCGGMVCIAGTCKACVDDRSCADDPAYGLGATCAAGACSSCTGLAGCACRADDTCEGTLACREGACVDCPKGATGCACFGNGTCNAGNRCADGDCQACPEGEDGCACRAGNTCDDGLDCTGGTCVPHTCQDGELGCACRAGETNRCDSGLTCAANSTCATCSPDVEGCPCASDNTCLDDLVCDGASRACRTARTCVQLGCVTHQTCQAQTPGVDAVCLQSCDAGYQWNANANRCDVIPTANCQPGLAGSILDMCNAQNRACVEASMGASCGACATGFIEEAGACRAAITCSARGCATQHRDCIAHTATADAVCGNCTAGYAQNSASGLCEAVPLANCDANSADSILAQCVAQNRACVSSETGAACGGCLSGFGLDPTSGQCERRLCSDLPCDTLGRTCAGEPLAACGGCKAGLVSTNTADPLAQCRVPLTCNDLACPDDQFCVTGDNTDAVCQTWPCLNADGSPDTNSSFDAFSNQCMDCSQPCAGVGLTGGLWPYTADGTCICQTQPGYFMDTGGAFVARPCDADSDGWVRTSARDALESTVPALVANARCDVRTIDRFVLQNELGQSLSVLLCVEGLVSEVGCSADTECGPGRCDQVNHLCACREAAPLPLYETVRNDDAAVLAMDADAPAYTSAAGTGRRLLASEVNPLTRACVSATADFNDNALADISEHQAATLATTGTDPFEAEMAIWVQMSYFMELHDGAYTLPAGNLHGRYTIRERSRCSSAFPVGYSASLDASYWRGCMRARDVDYDATGDNALVGYDFARWSCTSTSGTCLPGPVSGTAVYGEIAPHDLCDSGVPLPPADGVWRGMSHHSQFKCVQATNSIPADRDATAPQLRLLTELTSTAGQGDLQFNTCGVSCPVSDASCTADCVSSDTCATSSTAVSGNPDLAVVACTPVARDQVVEGQVGFAAVRYLDNPGVYTRGCMDEWQPSLTTTDTAAWRTLCPGYDTNPAALTGQGNPGNFGRLVCGCGFNFGGPECNVGCSNEDVHYGGSGTDSTCSNGYCPVDPVAGGRTGWWMCASWSSTGYTASGAALLGPETDAWVLRGEVSHDGIDHGALCESGNCTTGWRLQ